MKKDLLVPDIGDFENVEIIELLVKQGQKISIEIFWPCFTNSSIISTFSKSPISGTKRSFFII